MNTQIKEIVEEVPLTKLDVWSALSAEEESVRAVKVAHEPVLRDTARALSRGHSVLLECDKALSGAVLHALRNDPAFPNLNIFEATYNQGQPPAPDSVMSHLLEASARQIKDALTDKNRVVCFKHLDLMASTLDGRPRSELSDLIYWFCELPSVVKLSFWDPKFPPSEFVKAHFPVQLALSGIPRSRLAKLVDPKEAEKICHGDTFTFADQAWLYQLTASVHAIELRRILKGILQLGLVSRGDNRERLRSYFREATGQGMFVVPAEMAGYDTLQKQLMEIVVEPMDRLQKATNARELQQAQALVIRGLLLTGPPGTGKTSWAKWLAGKLNASLQIVHGPELKQRFVGETEAAIRRVFARARQTAPSMILIDEIDALTPSRNADASNHDKSMVAQVLTEMQGIREGTSVLVVGTTNRPEAVDAAFKRPGRFKLMEVGYPSAEDRGEILRHLSDAFGLELGREEFATLARETEQPVASWSGLASEGEDILFSGDHLGEVARGLLRKRLRAEREGTWHGSFTTDELNAAVEAVRAGSGSLPRTGSPKAGGGPWVRR